MTITSIIIDVDSFKLKKRAAAAGRTWPVKKIPYAYSNIIQTFVCEYMIIKKNVQRVIKYL